MTRADVGSESLRSLTDIAVGRDLAADGMLAEPRTDHVWAPSQVHLPGLGTIHLPHIEIPSPVTVDREWGRPGDLVTRDHEFT